TPTCRGRARLATERSSSVLAARVEAEFRRWARAFLIAKATRLARSVGPVFANASLRTSGSGYRGNTARHASHHRRRSHRLRLRRLRLAERFHRPFRGAAAPPRDGVALPGGGAALRAAGYEGRGAGRGTGSRPRRTRNSRVAHSKSKTVRVPVPIFGDSCACPCRFSGTRALTMSSRLSSISTRRSRPAPSAAT